MYAMVAFLFFVSPRKQQRQSSGSIRSAPQGPLAASIFERLVSSVAVLCAARYSNRFYSIRFLNRFVFLRKKNEIRYIAFA